MYFTIQNAAGNQRINFDPGSAFDLRIIRRVGLQIPSVSQIKLDTPVPMPEAEMDADKSVGSSRKATRKSRQAASNLCW